MATIPDNYTPTQRVHMAFKQLTYARAELPKPEFDRLTIILCELDALSQSLQLDPRNRQDLLITLPCPFCKDGHV